MTKNEVQGFLESHEWTFAKTMPLTPHWYIVKMKCKDQETFVKAVEFIKTNGVPGKFMKVTYKYLVLGDFKYWTMGYSPEKTTIINRVKSE